MLSILVTAYKIYVNYQISIDIILIIYIHKIKTKMLI